MASYDISPRAAREIDEIWWYGFERWSLDQANSYLSDLYQHLDKIIEGLAHNRPCEDVSGLWYSRYNAHIIYFEWDEDILYIVRIIHASSLQNLHT